MIQSLAVERTADAHRHDLVAAAESRRVARRARRKPGATAPGPATPLSATALPVTGGREVRRAPGSRVGNWLIQAGTRLGGATVSPS
jgi:hypothetical protein